MLGPAQKIAAFEKAVADIEAAFAAGTIGPITRREMLEAARDRYGMTNLANREPARPSKAPLTPEQTLAQKRERDRQYRERCKAARMQSTAA